MAAAKGERRSGRSQQLLLGIGAPKRTVGQTRFQQETARRGGPLEVAGKRFRGYREQRVEHEQQKANEQGMVNLTMPRLGKMPKVERE